MKIYLVIACSGDFDEYCETPIKAFTSDSSATKFMYDCRQWYIDNGIAESHEKYQDTVMLEIKNYYNRNYNDVIKRETEENKRRSELTHPLYLDKMNLLEFICEEIDLED